MSKILGIDTSTEALSVALNIEGVVYSHFEICPQKHSAKILPIIQKLTEQAKISVQDLDAITVTHGPGSFTGVRLGICVAQGLGFACELPIIPVSTLKVIAYQAFQKSGPAIDSVIVCLDARMSEVYFAVYTRNKKNLMELVPEQVAAPKNLAPMPELMFKQRVAGVGHGFDSYGELLKQRLELQFEWLDPKMLPDAKALVFLSESLFYKKVFVKPDQCQPVYLRNQVIQN